MSFYEGLIPNMFSYFEKFMNLDETDLEIIFAMIKESPDGPRNVRKIAKALGLPQQTVNYRVLRFEQLDLVRFRAVLNETLLGLANYVVIASVKPGLVYDNMQGKLVNAGTFLTCYPVWRLLKEVQGGGTHGFLVTYAIPTEKENDLGLFLNELQKIECLTSVDGFFKVTPFYSNAPSLELYHNMRKEIAQNRPISFNWGKWADDLDEAKETRLPEETVSKREILFSYEDLVVLFFLERNFREKFVHIAESMGESSGKVATRYRSVLRYGFIKCCKAEIYPIDPIHSMHIVLQLTLTNSRSLGKLVSHLDKVPYPLIYQKAVAKDILFLHTMIPFDEYFDFHNAFELWGRRQGIVHDIKLYVSNYYSRFDNIKLYEAFSRKGNRWLFSYDTMLQALKNLINATKFKF
jgi:DNA-binding Lrp family transcriptional regulator